MELIFQIIVILVGGGGTVVTAINVLAQRRVTAARAASDEAGTEQIVVTTAREVVALVRNENHLLLEQVATLQAEVETLKVRLTLAEARAQVGDDLRLELALAGEAIRELRLEIVELGGVPRH